MTPPGGHVVLVTAGTAGDMYPFLGVARGLMARGHRVTLLGPSVHARWAELAGVPYRGVGTVGEYRAALENPDLWHPRKGFEVVWRSGAPSLGVVAQFVASLPDDAPVTLLCHVLALPSADMARAVRPDVKIIAVHLAPIGLRTVHDPLHMGPLRIAPWVPMGLRRWMWRAIDHHVVDPIALPVLNDARRGLGLSPVRHFFDHLAEVPDAVVTLFPEWFAPRQPDWPGPLYAGDFVYYDPHEAQPLSPELTAFLAHGDAPIVFTAGSGQQHAHAYFRHAVAAAASKGRRAVLVAAHREQVPSALPEQVLWQAYVPFAALLPLAAALVHHGGIGTTAQALRQGVPQLVVPFAHDQFDNASRLAQLGAGQALPQGKASGRRMVAALRAVSEPEVKDRCVALARLVSRSSDRAQIAVEEALDQVTRSPSRQPPSASGSHVTRYSQRR